MSETSYDEANKVMLELVTKYITQKWCCGITVEYCEGIGWFVNIFAASDSRVSTTPFKYKDVIVMVKKQGMAAILEEIDITEG
ncbi:MAG: hypothetical protein ACXAEU_14470 [Candidatus Hodarchaeales archaeon]|jgi:hypothetical protein